MNQRVDDLIKCPRCAGGAHDFIGNRGSKMMAIQCCYCLFISFAPGNMKEDRDEPQPGAPGKYVLKHGRYQGMTIEAVANSGERGIEYLKWLASTSKALEPLVSSYLSSRPAVGSLHQSEAACP